MPPPVRFGGAPNNQLPAHYQQYPAHTQAQAGLPPPSFGGSSQFMNTNSLANPFSTNGNALGMAGGFGGSGPGLGMPGGTGLASHAAQMSFAAASQHHQGHNGTGEAGSRGGARRIREVWKHNLDEEMALLRKLIDHYNYISMDTEFPGVVARPMGNFQGKSDYHYQTLRCNVDMLKIIQIGITLFNEEGEEIPESTADLEKMGISLTGKRNAAPIRLPCTWQFNFEFSLKDDMYAESSIDSLRLAGLDFTAFEQDGIDPSAFAALLISSGLVCDDQVHWISFHGGYDFGYLTKILSCKALAEDEKKFSIIMKKWFPSIYDVKHLMKWAIKQHVIGSGTITPLDHATAEILSKFDQKSSLESVAEAFKVKRLGNAHTAGSDSLLTGKVFFKMREKIFNDDIPDDNNGKVWGLGFPETIIPQQTTPQHHHVQQENTTPNQNGNSYPNGAPSTPNTGNAALVGTPAHVTNNGGGPSTPGGGGISFGGGAFGGFMTNNSR